MNESGIRQLLHDSATDEVLGPPGVDLEHVVMAGRHSVVWRRSAVGVLAAGVIGVAIGIPVAFSSAGSKDQPADFGSGSTMSASVSRSIVDVVERAIPGTDVKLVPSRRSKPSSTGSLVSGNYGKDGKHLAGVSLTAYANAGTDVGGNPCTLRPGQVAGHQGAPAPDDVCTSVARPDGTTVWFWRMGHSASRPWTTADTEEVQVIYRRADGVAVNLSISNLLADSRYQTPKFVIPDDQMLAVVTAPEVTQLL